MPSKTPARRLPDDDDEPTTPVVAAVPDVDDEDEDTPTPPTKQSAASNTETALIRGGWTQGDKEMAATSNWAASLKLEEKAVILKFLEDIPYANFRRHWIERTTKDQGKMLRAWTCYQTIGKDCPLCEIGDRAQAVAAFNVAIVGDDGQVILKSWDVGPRLFGVLKGYANDPKIGPLTKGFFIASKTGKRGTVQHNVSPVSRSALEEDYDTKPPTPADLEEAFRSRYTPSIIDIPKLKDLQELADEIGDEYE